MIRKIDSIVSEGSATGFLQSDLHIVATSFELLGPVFGVGANKFMSGKTRYTDEPLGRARVVSDFLPSPEELVPRDDTVKVTIALSKSSVAFFKREAAKHNTQYQKMIRRLLDAYTESHEKAPGR